MRNNLILIFFGFSAAIAFSCLNQVQAEETMSDKMQQTQDNLHNQKEDVKKNIKKKGRKAKKKVRDSTGHGSMKKDLIDKKDDLRDDFEAEKNKR